MNDFISPINYTEEKENPIIDIKQVFKSASLILQIKKNKTEEETIVVVSRSKHAAFSARINYMKRINQHDKIDMFDLAGRSKRQLTVFPRGKNMKGQEDKSCKFSNRFRKFFYWYGSFVIYGMGFGVIVYLLMLGLSK